jgi:uncharacterized protein
MHRKSPSKIWRNISRRYALVGSKSEETGKVYFPPISVEPENGNTKFKPEAFAKRATLITWSTVTSPPTGYEKYKPYIVAILELENGERLTSQIVDVEEATLQKGDVLFPTFRKFFEDGKDGVIHYGLKWTKR